MIKELDPRKAENSLLFLMANPEIFKGFVPFLHKNHELVHELKKYIILKFFIGDKTVKNTVEVVGLKEKIDYEFEVNIRDSIEELGIEKVMNAVGVEKIINAVGVEKIINAVGVEKIINAMFEEIIKDERTEKVKSDEGIEKVINTVGLEKVINALDEKKLDEIITLINKRKGKIN